MDAHVGGFQIFTFSGTIRGQGPGATRRGFARANSQKQVIEAMSDWGFNVKAITGLSELRESIEVMELIARGDPEVPASDYINLLAAQHGTFREDEVFAISGHGVGQAASLGGYAVASDAGELIRAMRGLHFEVHAYLSLTQARAVLVEMEGLEPGDEGLVDLEEHASLH